jgi:hypothetical protein
MLAAAISAGLPDLCAQRAGELPAGLPPSVVSALKNYVDIPSSLKDFSCDIQFSDGPGKSIDGRFLFKSPDKAKFQSKTNTTYDSGVPLMMVRQLIPTIAFPFFLGVLPPINWTESKDASGGKAQGKIVEDGKAVGTAVIETSPAGALSRIALMESESPAPQTIEIRFSSQNRNGRQLLTGVEARNGTETLRWDWEYTTVGEVVLVSRAISVDETGQRNVSTCSNYKLNEGLADSLF